MIVKKLRLQRNWSQEQLSEFSDLSVRTVQRIEKGEKVGLESLKSLAAVFEVDVNDLQDPKVADIKTESPQFKESLTMSDRAAQIHLSLEEQQAMKYVENIKAFYQHMASFIGVMLGLFILNMVVSPGHWWFMYTLIGWGIGLVAHGLVAFEVFKVFGPEWEKQQIEKRLGRKL